MPAANENPAEIANEASDAAQNLARATSRLRDLSEVSPVIGSLLPMSRALSQICYQLADNALIERDNALLVGDEDGEAPVLVLATTLREAGHLLAGAEMALERAHQDAAEIAWTTDPPGGRGHFDEQWVSVVFLDGEEADEVLDMIDRDGTDAAITHLSGYDYGQETTDAALADGHVYETPPCGLLGNIDIAGPYTLSYNRAFGHVGLYRLLDDPGPGDHGPLAAPAATSDPVSGRPGRLRESQRTAATGAGFDAFTARTSPAARTDLGRSL